MQTIIIDEEFKSLLPALDRETYASLEANLIENGCRDALVLWNDILIDGHNRYKICTEHGIPFNTTSKDFASREEVLIWIISTQMSRRNLTRTLLRYYRGKHYRMDKKMVANPGGKNQYTEDEGQNDPEAKKQTTAELLSDKYRVSPKTIKRDANLADAIDAIGETSLEAKRMILSEEVNITKKALEELSFKQKEDIEEAANKIESGAYEKEKPAAPAPADSAKPKENALKLIRSLDKAVRSMSDGLDSELAEITEKSSRAELRAALKPCLDMLDNLYKRI